MESAIIKEEKLEVPHPHMQNRMFVLIPMLELSPEWIHPEFQKSISTLISECKDELAVTKI
jgi:2-amino-4-hydroxy-6-hydroxymethyldihydropteridine diphosphokinase